MNFEENLIRRAQQGDRAAFDALVTQHRPHIVCFCARLLHCAAEAEQAAQDVFLRAWQYMGSFSPGGALRPWLERIAVSICLNLLRTKKGRDIAGGLRYDDPDAGAWLDTHQAEPGVEAQVVESVFAEQILKAVRACALLSKPRWDALDWQIFHLRYEQNVETTREAARILMKSEDTIRYRIYHHIAPVLKAVAADMERK